ncbi:MAG: glycosyltransferase family 2 protein [Flavipsychrobacter sp.]|jgi:glycosyltransferase involved in cell wall biosynthesis|nr:glycosyltransferase family 2 protein [Flavipsychrobacter sp.]
MRPIAIPSYIDKLWKAGANTGEKNIELVQQQYMQLYKGEPEVSVVIPAYNEEKNILRTLLSLSLNTTKRAVEIIVVNNNSKDNTEALVKATGVICILETKQGITAARNAGLKAAKGKYVLNADADSIYPPDWIEEMVAPLDSSNVAITYGRFGFIPTGRTSRTSYFFYEQLADTTRWINKKFREEAVNVYGFNSGFRRAQGIEVNGFEHPPGANEDGWLAVKLRNKGFGKLHCVSNPKAMVWTADRRIEMDGGLWKALFMRAKRILFPSREVVIRKDL